MKNEFSKISIPNPTADEKSMQGYMKFNSNTFEGDAHMQEISDQDARDARMVESFLEIFPATKDEEIKLKNSGPTPKVIWS